MHRNPSTRRRVLKSTGAATLPPRFPPSFPFRRRAGALAPSERIVMGVIGVGGRGTGDLRVLPGRKDVRMVAVCDVSGERLANAKQLVDETCQTSDCAACMDMRELLAARRAKEQSTGKQHKGKALRPPEEGPREKDQYNFIGPESRIRKVRGGFEQSDNAQAAVEVESMLIVDLTVFATPRPCLQFPAFFCWFARTQTIA